MGVETGLGCGLVGYPTSYFLPRTWPYQEPQPKFLTGLQGHTPSKPRKGCNRHKKAMLLNKGYSENLGLSFGCHWTPWGSPFFCIVARRSCLLGHAHPPAVVSPVSCAWSDWPTVRICTGPRASGLSSASAAGPLVPAGHGQS